MGLQREDILLRELGRIAKALEILSKVIERENVHVNLVNDDYPLNVTLDNR